MRSSSSNGILATAMLMAASMGSGAAEIIKPSSRSGPSPVQQLTSRPRTKRGGYVDRVGMPHGRSGDKLVRKAMTGQAGMTKPKGWLHTWSSTKVASLGLGDRRRGAA